MTCSSGGAIKEKAASPLVLVVGRTIVALQCLTMGLLPTAGRYEVQRIVGVLVIYFIELYYLIAVS